MVKQLIEEKVLRNNVQVSLLVEGSEFFPEELEDLDVLGLDGESES